MNLIAKLVTAAQALLLAQLGAVKSGDAATPSDLTEATEWDAAISAGTPEAFQQYISQFPRGERLGEAFELIVLSEIETAKSLSDAAVSDIQLSEARREDLEVLERNFDLGTRKTDESQSEESDRLGPY
jgi:hypothetical protein